jgi:hypothetical protein
MALTPTPEAPAWTRTWSFFWIFPMRTRAWKAITVKPHGGHMTEEDIIFLFVHVLAFQTRTGQEVLWDTCCFRPREMLRLPDDVGLRDVDVFRIAALFAVRIEVIQSPPHPTKKSFDKRTPPTRPNTGSPTFQSLTPSPSSTMTPENSTPRICEAPEGGGYFPSRWEISMRFNPNALI